MEKLLGGAVPMADNQLVREGQDIEDLSQALSATCLSGYIANLQKPVNRREHHCAVGHMSESLNPLLAFSWPNLDGRLPH